MAQIELEHLSKRFGDIVAVDDLSVTIEDGEFVVFVGPSGCGKTTTLRMVAGLERATSGDIRIAGKRVNERAPKDRDLAMVFQNYALYSHFDVRRNLAYPLRARGAPKQEIQEKVADVARLLGLEDTLDRRPRQLSGGQRQRVALGRAMIRDPQAFLMDEPLSNLDAALRLQMRKELTELSRRLETTVMYVTHDQIEAMTMADRMVVMYGGRAQQIATPDEVYNKPANRFVAGFVGTPPMNFIAATVTSSDGGEPRLRSGGFDTPAPAWLEGLTGSKVTVGLRPEHCHLTGSGDGFPATVQVVENLGSDALVYIDAGGDHMSIEMDAHSRPRVGETVHVRPEADRLHFFDIEDGTRLDPERADRIQV